MARCRVSKWVFLLAKIFWNEWKKKGIKVKKQTCEIICIFTVISVSLLQTKISVNETRLHP